MPTTCRINLGSERDTLEIVVSDDWLNQPYERRLGDAQDFWRLWVVAYTPDGGIDRALIRLTKDDGSEVGGSRQGQGSSIWVLP